MWPFVFSPVFVTFAPKLPWSGDVNMNDWLDNNATLDTMIGMGQKILAGNAGAEAAPVLAVEHRERLQQAVTLLKEIRGRA